MADLESRDSNRRKAAVVERRVALQRAVWLAPRLFAGTFPEKGAGISGAAFAAFFDGIAAASQGGCATQLKRPRLQTEKLLPDIAKLPRQSVFFQLML